MILLSGWARHERVDHIPVIFLLVRGRRCWCSNDRSYRLRVVPIISGGEDTNGIERRRVSNGEHSRAITHRYVVGWEAMLALVGQSESVWFKAGVDFVRTKKTEIIICRV